MPVPPAPASPQKPPRRPLGGLALVLAGVLLLAGAFYALNPPAPGSHRLATAPVLTGVSPVAPQAVRRLFPQTAEQPLLLEFDSRWCLDCKRMRPVIDALLKEFPQLAMARLDITEDRKAHPEAFEAFKPSMVPVLVFIEKGGRIQGTLSGYQKKPRVRAALQALADTAGTEGSARE